MTVHEDRRGIGDLLGDLGRQVSTLVRQELDLARTEISAGLGRMTRGLAVTGIGGALCYAGVLVLLAAIVFGLVDAGLDPWLASAVVGGLALLIGGVLTAMGVGQVREARLAPTETAETMKENVEYVKEQLR